MSVALVLLGYASLAAVLAPWVLRRPGWLDRMPALGVLVWQALTASVLLSAVLAGLALLVPTFPFSASLAGMLDACVMAIRAQYASPGGAAAGSGGTVLALAVAGRTVFCLARGLAETRRHGRSHLQVLGLVGRPGPEPGVVVVEHDVAVAYCLPGRGKRIVLSSVALAALDPAQLRAVLAHERAHLRGRHHLAVAAAAAVAAAFPRVPLFRVASTEVARLVELIADDAAGRVADRLSLAEALLTLAESRAPIAALAAGGTAAGARVRRLLLPHRRMGLAGAFAGVSVAFVLVALPLAIAVTPAVAASTMDFCPVPQEYTLALR